ncbi:MAG TPA: hypothetical protein VFQ23_08955 [Anaerolineales bacterium]|nr:hypothetical protein [Anaerolineales bacterium]
MTKAHPLTKLQSLLAILLLIPFCVISSVEESKQSVVLFIGMIPFIGLSLITIYLGWLMVFKKEDIIYPHESFSIRFTEKSRGKQAAKNLIAMYTKTSRKMLIGGMNIVSGLLCLISAVVGIVVILRTL